MRNENKEGPSTRTIPERTEQVCINCKFFDIQPMMFGHNYVTKNYSCSHPDIVHEWKGISLHGGNRSISHNSTTMPSTPIWCPFLNKKSDAAPI